MNKIVTTERSGASAVSMSHSDGGSYLQAESLGDVVRFAELMCQSKAGIPSYLHGNAADCMAVTMQALQWSFNPFSVAQKSYKIKDVIAYEAQLIAAVINTRADLKRRPQYEFRGEGADRQCIVTFEFNDGSVQVYESPRFDRITPKNSPLWKTDPDQQQAYYSIRAGARRYCPEVILGAYDRDEVEEFRGPDSARDVTPKSPVMERLRQSAQSAPETPADEQEGFSASSIQQQTDRVLTGDIIDNNSPSDEAPPLASPVEDDASTSAVVDDPPSSQQPGDAQPSPASPGSVSQPEFVPIPEKELTVLRRFARDVLRRAHDPETSGELMTKIVNRWINIELANVHSDSGREAVKAIHRSVKAIMKCEASYEAAVDHHAEGLGCTSDELMGEPDNG